MNTNEPEKLSLREQVLLRVDEDTDLPVSITNEYYRECSVFLVELQLNRSINKLANVTMDLANFTSNLMALSNPNCLPPESGC